jgi:uncharacterized protein
VRFQQEKFMSRAVAAALMSFILTSLGPAVAQENSAVRPFVMAQQSAKDAPRAPREAPVRVQTAWEAQRERLNLNTITIITGTPAGTYLAVAHDMSVVMDDGDNLRVLAVTGKGSVQNVKDILHLRGVDMGIVQSDVMSHFKSSGEYGQNFDQRLLYIAKLYNEEMHLIVNSKIKSIKDLTGQKVSFAEVGSGTQFSSRLIFGALGVKIDEVNLGLNDALLKVKSGEISGLVWIGGRPSPALAKLTKDPELKLLPVPYTAALEEASYLPAALSSSDYPALLADGEQIETVAVGAVLAVYNWAKDTDRYRRVSKFTETLFTRFPELQKAPRHPKWKEVNLAAKLKGWTRFSGAQAWLDAQPAPVAAPKANNDTILRKQAAQAAPGDPAEQERLFQQFMEWKRQQQPVAR